MEFLKIGCIEKNHVVKVWHFSGANVEDMRHNLMPIIKKKPSHLIIHAGTNDAKDFAWTEILDQLLNFEKLVCEQVPDFKAIISVRANDGKAELTVRRLAYHLRQLKTDLIDNTNITSQHTGFKGFKFFWDNLVSKKFCKIWMNKGCSGIEKKGNSWIWASFVFINFWRNA